MSMRLCFAPGGHLRRRVLIALSLAAVLLVPASPTEAGRRFGNRATRRNQPSRTTRPAARQTTPRPKSAATPSNQQRTIVPPPSVAPEHDWAKLGYPHPDPVPVRETALPVRVTFEDARDDVDPARLAAGGPDL